MNLPEGNLVKKTVITVATEQGIQQELASVQEKATIRADGNPA